MALSGPDLCSGTTDGDTLPTATWEDRQITINNPVELTQGTEYIIVIRAPNSQSTLSLHWAIKYLGTHFGFSYSDDSGDTWNVNPLYGGWFTTDGDSYNPTGTISENFGQTQWRGDQFTASSTYTVNSITLRLQRASQTVGTITVSIRKVYDTPSKATNPTPSDTANNVTLDQQTITWENGGGATSYDVYYGTESGNLTLLESGVTDTSYTIFQITNGSPFAYAVTRYWRIDAVNQYGTTTGDEWSFTTITFAAPPPGPRGSVASPIDDKQLTTKTRLVAFARNKVFYEDV